MTTLKEIKNNSNHEETLHGFLSLLCEDNKLKSTLKSTGRGPNNFRFANRDLRRHATDMAFISQRYAKYLHYVPNTISFSKLVELTDYLDDITAKLLKIDSSMYYSKVELPKVHEYEEFESFYKRFKKGVEGKHKEASKARLFRNVEERYVSVSRSLTYKEYTHRNRVVLDIVKRDENSVEYGFDTQEEYKYSVDLVKLTREDIKNTRAFHRNNPTKIMFLSYLIGVDGLYQDSGLELGCTTLGHIFKVTPVSICNYLKSLYRLGWITQTNSKWLVGKRSKMWTCSSKFLFNLFYKYHTSCKRPRKSGYIKHIRTLNYIFNSEKRISAMNRVNTVFDVFCTDLNIKKMPDIVFDCLYNYGLLNGVKANGLDYYNSEYKNLQLPEDRKFPEDFLRNRLPIDVFLRQRYYGDNFLDHVIKKPETAKPIEDKIIGNASRLVCAMSGSPEADDNRIHVRNLYMDYDGIAQTYCDPIKMCLRDLVYQALKPTVTGYKYKYVDLVTDYTHLVLLTPRNTSQKTDYGDVIDNGFVYANRRSQICTALFGVNGFSQSYWDEDDGYVEETISGRPQLNLGFMKDSGEFYKKKNFKIHNTWLSLLTTMYFKKYKTNWTSQSQTMKNIRRKINALNKGYYSEIELVNCLTQYRSRNHKSIRKPINSLSVFLDYLLTGDIANSYIETDKAGRTKSELKLYSTSTNIYNIITDSHRNLLRSFKKRDYYPMNIKSDTLFRPDLEIKNASIVQSLKSVFANADFIHKRHKTYFKESQEFIALLS